MKVLQKIPLLAWIVIAILGGVLIGSLTPGLISGINSAAKISIPTDVVVQIFVSFSTIFSAFLSFAIPLIIIGFIVPGIGSLAQGAGKMLGVTVGLSYLSSIVAGFLALTAALFLYPILLKGQQLESFDNPENALSSGYVTFKLEPIMSVMSALILSFILGLGITALKSRSMLNLFEDFQVIVEKMLGYVIIPLLPVHIVGVFANMTLAGQVVKILSVFGMVFIMVILLHWFTLCIQYTAAGAVSKRNPAKMLKTMLPAYFTAIGTQSSGRVYIGLVLPTLAWAPIFTEDAPTACYTAVGASSILWTDACHPAGKGPANVLASFPSPVDTVLGNQALLNDHEL